MRLCPLLPDTRRHEAPPPARLQKHFQVATHPCRRIQPERDAAPADGCGHTTGVEEPGGNASLADLSATRTPGISGLAHLPPNFDVPGEILRKRTQSNAALAVSKISYLHGRLLTFMTPTHLRIATSRLQPLFTEQLWIERDRPEWVAAPL